MRGRDQAHPHIPLPHTHGALVRWMQRGGLEGLFFCPGPIRVLHVPRIGSDWPIKETSQFPR